VTDEGVGVGSAESKALVQRFLGQGVSSPESLAMLTDDFRWIAPRSMVDMFPRDEAVLRRDDMKDLPFLDEAIYRGYDKNAQSSNVHFMIAEGDVVVMEFDASFTTFEGEPYHNQYCLVFIVRDGMIAEVHEHVDTAYSRDVILGTPEKHAGVMDRLARLRAGEKLSS
jgi:ketosteroid isomerase-like protein